MAREAKTEAARSVHLIYSGDILVGIFEDTVLAHILANHIKSSVVRHGFNNIEGMVRKNKLPYKVTISLGSRYSIVAPAVASDLARALALTAIYMPEAHVGYIDYEDKTFKIIGPAARVWLWAGSESEAEKEAKKAAKGVLEEHRNINAIYRRVLSVRR